MNNIIGILKQNKFQEKYKLFSLIKKISKYNNLIFALKKLPVICKHLRMNRDSFFRKY